MQQFEQIFGFFQFPPNLNNISVIFHMFYHFPVCCGLYKLVHKETNSEHTDERDSLGFSGKLNVSNHMQAKLNAGLDLLGVTVEISARNALPGFLRLFLCIFLPG